MSTPVQRGASIRASRPRKNPWVVRSFVVHRRDDHHIANYRSVVYTCFPESAEFGIGLSRDETARKTNVSFVDGLGASRAVRAEEIADFWENLGMTVKGGGTESIALVRATRMAVTARMRGVLGTIRWRLNQGRDLHVALGEFREIFPKAHCALAEAATELTPDERAGIYLSLARTLREQESRGRKFATTMLDQIITGAMLVVLVFVTLVYFVPNFASMFRGMELDLPWPYRIANAAGQCISHYAWIAIPAIIAASAGIVFAIRRALKHANIQRRIARLPVVGPLVRALALARSLPLFAALHKAGVHPETNFRLAGEASGNALIEDFFRSAYRRCAAGLDMEKAFLAERLQLGLEEGRRLAGKIEAGSEMGDLEGVLCGLAEEFSERANLSIEALPKVIKPINLAAMGLVIGAMAALVGLPSMLVLEKTFQQQNQHARHYYEQKIDVHKN